MILYSPLKLAKRISLERSSNITAKQYNSPPANITEKTLVLSNKSFFGSFELNDTNSKRLNFTDFSLHFYYNIKKHSLQYKNAESSLEIYNGNTKQTPAKLQPLSNNIFS